MNISNLIKNLESELKKHGDIQVVFWSTETGDEVPVDVVEFEAEDKRAAKPEPRIVLGE